MTLEINGTEFVDGPGGSAGRVDPLPPRRRLLVGTGVALAILVLAFVSMNILNSWGVWVTLLLVSLLTASALLLWIRDAVVYPATGTDEGDPS